MRDLNRSFLLTIFCTNLVAFVVGPMASAEYFRWQEAKEEERQVKRVKRISVGESPCVFVATSHKRGSLGVHLTDLTPELRAHFGAPADAGVMVSKVVEESPASKAGVRVGDIFTAVDGEEVSSAREVARTVRRKSAGDEVVIELRRDGKLTKLNATIEARERSEIDLGGIFTGVDCDEMDFTMDLHIDEEAIHEAVEKARRHFESPEWRSQWRWLERLDEEALEERMEELEERLEELEEELKEKQSKLEEELDRY